jgi:hypothetical protein
VSIIDCPSCGARNRVAPIPRGAPRCARSKSMLPWLVEADTDGEVVDRIVGALPRHALEARLAPLRG